MGVVLELQMACREFQPGFREIYSFVDNLFQVVILVESRDLEPTFKDIISFGIFFEIM